MGIPAQLDDFVNLTFALPLLLQCRLKNPVPSCMPKGKVLITDHAHPLLAKGLEQMGFVVDVHSDITPERVDIILHGYTGVVINSKVPIRESLMLGCPDLQFIARLGSGLEIIDLHVAQRLGIQVFSAPEGNCNAVAEHALGMLLCLANRIIPADHQLRHFHWHREANRGWEIAGKNVGIIGAGHTGRSLIRKLIALDAKVYVYDKYDPSWQERFPKATLSSPEELARICDVLSLHLPLTPETHHYINMAFIHQCKPGMILINTARGHHVDIVAVVEALEHGHLGGACLDVFEQESTQRMTPEERLIYTRLYALPNVVLTPHIAGWTQESLEGIASVLLEKISFWLKNRPALA